MKTLYHYCDASAFTNIISNRSIRLSSLALSNDTMEGCLVPQIFERLLCKENIDLEEMEDIRYAIHAVEELFDGLGFCLSEKPDTLSQWRGYADNGQGFSIGFSKTYLQELGKAGETDKSGFRLGKVLYKELEHNIAVKPTYDQIKALIDSGDLKRPKHGGITGMLSKEEMKKIEYQYRAFLLTLTGTFLTIFPHVHLLKGKAFSEETEWRLLSYFSKNKGDNISFRGVSNKIVPYRAFELKRLRKKSIVEVYVGPKNITPDFVLKRFLSLNNFPNVKIKRSTATYR